MREILPYPSTLVGSLSPSFPEGKARRLAPGFQVLQKGKPKHKAKSKPKPKGNTQSKPDSGSPKDNPYLYYPPRLLPIPGYSDSDSDTNDNHTMIWSPLVAGSRLSESLLTIIILSQLLLTDEFPVANPTKHGRNYFVRQLHYAAGEVRSYTLYFPMHRTVFNYALRVWCV